MTSPLPDQVAERLESLEVLDAPAQTAGKAIRQAVPRGPVKDAISGTWLGHALHPLLTDVTIGAFTGAAVLDLIGGRESAPAAERLVAVGLAATPPTVLTGLSDWADSESTDDGVRRAGMVHWALNAGAAAFMVGSLLARRRGALGRGRMLGLAGLTLMSGGGWIGGHLAYAEGVGVDRTVFEKGPQDWTPTGVTEDALADGRAVRGHAEGVPVLLVQRGGRVHALHDHCNHRGGSLCDGELGDGTVTCPLHGSVFRLEDGAVERGPATHAQPVFEARVMSGAVEVRRTAA